MLVLLLRLLSPRQTRRVLLMGEWLTNVGFDLVANITPISCAEDWRTHVNHECGQPPRMMSERPDDSMSTIPIRARVASENGSDYFRLLPLAEHVAKF